MKRIFVDFERKEYDTRLCVTCAVEGEVIALEDVGLISNLERYALEQWLNPGNLHLHN